MRKGQILAFILIILFSGCTQTETLDVPIEVIDEQIVEIEETVQEPISKQYELDLSIKAVPSKYSEMGEHLPKYGEVFEIPFFASQRVSDAKLLHAMNIMAQYLDNDEDGTPDNLDVVDELINEQVGMIMFADENEAENSRIWDSDLPLGNFQELYAEETIISGSRFDASLEEVFHLITDIGYEGVYPSVFGEFS